MREFPASPSQATAWFLHQQGTRTSAQNVQLSVSLGEPVAPARLREIWTRIAVHHPFLRWSFRRDASTGVVRREHETAEVAWRALDWTGVPITELSSRWASFVEEDLAQPLDLQVPPLLRLTVLELPGGHAHLLITMSRLLVDEDEWFFVLCEFLEAVDGHLAEATEETPSEPDKVSEEFRKDAVTWWKAALEKVSPHRLAFHPARPPVDSTSFAEVTLLLDRDATRDCKSLAQKASLSPDLLLLSLWGLILARLSGRQDAALLADTAEGNLLPYHITFAPEQKISQWLASIARLDKERESHGLLSLEEISGAEALDLYASVFRFAPPSLNDRIHDTYPRWINVDARFLDHPFHRLFLDARDGNRISLRLRYQEGSLADREAEGLLDRLRVVLASACSSPDIRLSALSLLLPGESSAALQPPARKSSAPKPVPVEEAIAESFILYPSETAIEAGGSSLTYAEIEEYSNHLASHFRAENLADGWTLAVCLTPSPWVPVAILGVMNSGNTCIPLDPEAGASWLASQMESADAELVICDSATAPLFEASGRKTLVLDVGWEQISTVPISDVKPTRPPVAFLFPGTPQIPAPSPNTISPDIVAATVKEASRVRGIAHGERLLLLAAPGTSAYVEEILSSLSSGALLSLPETRSVTELATTPAAHLALTVEDFEQWAAQADALSPSLHTILIEARTKPLSAGALARWQALATPEARLIQFTGPGGLFGTALHFEASATTEGELPLNPQSRVAQPRFTDSGGSEALVGCEGHLVISAEGSMPFELAFRAWRDSEGLLHLLPPAADVPEHGLAAGLFAPKVVPKPAPVPAPQPAATPSPVASARVPESVPAVSATTPTPAPKPVAAGPWTPLKPLGGSEDSPILICVHDAEGSPDIYKDLARHLDSDWKMYATVPRDAVEPSAWPSSVISEAEAFLPAITALDSDSSIHLIGFGYGAVLAMEIARKLRASGLDVPYLVLIGSRPPAISGGGWMKALSRGVSDAVRGKKEPTNSAQGARLAALRSHKAVPLYGPAGVIITNDLGMTAESGWLDCLPEAGFEAVSCASTEVLSEPAVRRLAAVLREFAQPSESGD